MNRFLLDYDDGHMVFESEEDMIKYIAIGSVDNYSLKFSKIEYFSVDELIQFHKTVNKEKESYRRENKMRLTNEISKLNSKLDEIGTEILYTDPKNINSIRLLKNEKEILSRALKLKEKEFAKYV